MLLADMQAVHAAATSAVDKATSFAKPPVDAASSSRELEVSETRRDAVAFSDDEEAFFKRAESHSVMHPKFDSFDDLDEGYEAPKFWDKVFGRKKPLVKFNGRRILYTITLRPLFFRRSTPRQRIATVLHQLFHISRHFDGTLEYVRKYDVDIGKETMFWMGIV